MLTDRDIITAVIAQEVDPATLRVEDVMTSDVVTALEEDSLMDVLGLMRRKGLRRLPVTSADRVLQGLITLDDLLGILSEQLRAMVLAIEAEQLRERKVRP
jgi:CBS domain-containing protein